MALLVTNGFKDLLHIGNQSRPLIFDLKIDKPDNLYEQAARYLRVCECDRQQRMFSFQVVEIDERVVLERHGEALPQHGAREGAVPLAVVEGITGERVVVERAPDEASVRAQLAAVRGAGITSVAVVLMHAYTFAGHEQLVGRWAAEAGFTQISLSSDVMPMVRTRWAMWVSALLVGEK
jgi:5-oxoprolinase (ATP-hydrolysing)